MVRLKLSWLRYERFSIILVDKGLSPSWRQKSKIFVYLRYDTYTGLSIMNELYHN